MWRASTIWKSAATIIVESRLRNVIPRSTHFRQPRSREHEDRYFARAAARGSMVVPRIIESRRKIVRVIVHEGVQNGLILLKLTETRRGWVVSREIAANSSRLIGHAHPTPAVSFHVLIDRSLLRVTPLTIFTLRNESLIRPVFQDTRSGIEIFRQISVDK